MKCREIREQLSPYLEGDLSGPLRSRIEKHLSDCAGCAVELKQMRGLVADLKKLPQPVVGPEFRSGVWQKIDAEARPAPWKKLFLDPWSVLDPWFVKIPVGALATAAVALLVINVFRKAEPKMERQALMDATFSEMDASGPKEARRQAPAPQARKSEEENEMFKADAVMGQSSTLAAAGAARDEAALPSEHIQLKVADLASAEQAIARLLKEIPMHELNRPLPARYELTMGAEQYTLLIGRLKQIGEVSLQGTPSDRFLQKDRDDQTSRHVILDLLPQ